MGKNREKAYLVINEFEKELNEKRKHGMKEWTISKRVKAQLIEMARQRGIPIDRLLEEMRPIFEETFEAVEAVQRGEQRSNVKTIPPKRGTKDALH